MGYEAFVVDDNTREALLQRFPPMFPDVICHHITNRFGVRKEDNRPFGRSFEFVVVGHSHDDRVQALVVSRAGSTIRPDGREYHITLSLDRSLGARPADSNRVIDQLGYKRVADFGDQFRFNATFEYIE
jgi:hypothetical protein